MHAASGIKEHMIVVANDGTEVGTVDRVEAEHLKLTRADSADGQHHLVPLHCVASVENDRVILGISGDDFRRMAN